MISSFPVTGFVAQEAMSPHSRTMSKAVKTHRKPEPDCRWNHVIPSVMQDSSLSSVRSSQLPIFFTS